MLHHTTDPAMRALHIANLDAERHWQRNHDFDAYLEELDQYEDALKELVFADEAEELTA